MAVVLCAGAAASAAAPACAGSGFLLRSQSATTLGTAQAGMSTNTEDLSSMVFNPALLGYAKAMEFTAGITPIFPRGHFDPASSTTALGTPIGGSGGGNRSAIDGYPLNVYFARPLTNELSAGVALTSLYGLGFEYEEGWVGRYHAGKSRLLSVDIIPSLAYKAGPVSLGVGLDVKYARARTRTAIDFGTIAFAASSGALGIPSGNDGSLSTRLDDWGVGFIVGASFDPGETGKTRIGVSYRSKVKTALAGKATFDTGGQVGETVAALTGQFRNTDARASLTFPAAVTAGISQELSDKWRILADVQWTQWSSLRELALAFENPLQQPVVTDLRWRDSWFVAAGVRYRYDARWVLRAGLAYDQSPARGETSTPALPDARGVWATLGGAYHFDARRKLDFAYGHIFVRNNPVSLQASSPGNAARGTLTGTFRGSSVNFFSLQVSSRF